MDVDKRIADIMLKMKGLSAKHPMDTCGEFPPRWNEPLTEEKVRNFEVRNGINLPEDYRRFITTVAKGGTQPFYGLCSIDEIQKHELTADVKEKFPYTLKNPLNIDNISDEEYHKLFDGNYSDTGFIELCDEGCAMFNILIVNSDDEETYGTVWFYDLADDAGIFPLVDPKSGKAMCFIDWLEYYVDRTLELDDDDYFSYSELVGDF
ncbi:MAG: SMI1/KNR4 family protein [Oscillospiraceae bacterium]|nr:SMI1/KNR4 family protein [Oscillospiraceae bacterium]